MSRVPTPQLDARTFEDLVEAGKRQIASMAPEWNDLSVSDPGIVLLEVFAFLTDALLFRVNRLPDRAYDSFLRLIGVRRHPASAATVRLIFTRTGALDVPLEVPRGTRVTVSRAAGSADSPVFSVVSSGEFNAGTGSLELTASHAEAVNGELAGVGTGLPGQVVNARRSPIVDPAGGELPLIVAVESGPESQGGAALTIDFGGVAHRIWREVEDFSHVGDDRSVYVADRAGGTIAFAPAVRQRRPDGALGDQPTPLGAAPAAGRAIRLWYWVGGGAPGNVAEDSLTVLRDPIPGVQVTNPARATGGRAAESYENARIRGPVEFRRLERAVTARDFEDLATRASTVSRALAFAKAELWAHATPGTVRVLLVPSIPDLEAEEYRVSPATLASYQTATARDASQRMLDERRPLGTLCEVGWARAKMVTVRVRVVVHRHADRLSVERQVLTRLFQSISPVQTPLQPGGWPFGRPLRSWDVNLIVEAVPGVQYADQVRLLVDSAPDTNVESIAPAPAQPRMWYAGSDDALFRSSDDGEGWEQVARLIGQRIIAVRPHSRRPGLLAIIGEEGENGPSRITLSADCAESTRDAAAGESLKVHDVAWIMRDGKPLLLLATDTGLVELGTEEGARPNSVSVTGPPAEAGLYAIASMVDNRGAVRVAVAVQNGGGVLLSDEGGRAGTFRPIGPSGNKDIRSLVMQHDGDAVALWAGVTAAGFEAGEGCLRIQLTDAGLTEGWRTVGTNWDVLGAGTCNAIAFSGTRVVAASERRGVLWLDMEKLDSEWRDVRAGLPQQADGQPAPVRTVAVTPDTGTDAGRDSCILVGGPQGVWRAREPDGPYMPVSRKELDDKATLPPTWLFCSGEHDVTVVYEDAVG